MASAPARKFCSETSFRARSRAISCSIGPLTVAVSDSQAPYALRILIVVPAYYPAERFGGPIRSIHNLAKGLVNIGFDVTVFATNSNGTEDLSVAVGVPTLLDGVKVSYF